MAPSYLKIPLTLLLIAMGSIHPVQAAGATYQFRQYAKGVVGTVKSLSVTPASLGFPAANPGQSSTRDIFVENTGTADIIFAGISVVSGAADFNSSNNCGIRLAPGALCTISVQATPSVAGNRSGSLVVVSDALDSPQMIDLSVYGNFLPSTLGNFSIAGKPVGAAPFTLTAPTSNSAGAFTYASNNPAVATVAGDILTIVGVGQATVTATQAAFGNYNATSTQTQFDVIPVPTVTLTENFEGAPVFTRTGNSTLVPSWLGPTFGLSLVTPTSQAYGEFKIYFDIPAGATNATLQLSVRVDYPNNIYMQKLSSGSWGPNLAVSAALSPGSYRIISDGQLGCPYSWCANGKTYVDNIVVKYAP